MKYAVDVNSGYEAIQASLDKKAKQKILFPISFLLQVWFLYFSFF